MLTSVRSLARRFTHFHEVMHLRRVLASREAELRTVREHADKLEETLERQDRFLRSADYHADSLAVWNRNLGFLRDRDFLAAYRKGMDSGHKIGRPKGSRDDIHLEWRVHVACWAARHALALDGAYVECGVNTGILSLAVCHYLDFNSTGKSFFLFDTYAGIPEEQMRPEERANRLAENRELYEDCYAQAQKNFAPFARAKLVRGKVPDSLACVPIDRVCYLSLDMNIAEPEIAAIRYFWDRLAPGAPILLDDYAWASYELQQEEMNRFAADKGVAILTLPTGQGLMIKPRPAS